MAAVEALCSRTLLLEFGKVARDGEASEVVKHHLLNMMDGSPSLLHGGETRYIKSLRMTDQRGDESTAFQIGDSVYFEIELFSAELVERPRLGIAFYTSGGQRVATLNSDIQQTHDWPFSGGKRLRAVWSNIPLNTGEYRVDVSLWSSDGELETLTGCASLNVCAKDVYGTGRLPDPLFQGFLVPDGHWELNLTSFSNETVSLTASKDNDV
jgi:lipopolysaccharide transport system ATP-binding protein